MIGPSWVELVGGPYDGVVFDLTTGITTSVLIGYGATDVDDLPSQYQRIDVGGILLDGVHGEALYEQLSDRRWGYVPPAAL